MQLDPIKPMLKPPGNKRLKLNCDMLLLKSAFKFNLRRYIKDALENACSQYPKLEGRFAQVSGMAYTFDAALPAGARVVSVEIPKGTPLDEEKLYKVRLDG